MAITFDKFTTYGNTQIFGADKSNLFVIGFDNANNNEFKYSLSNFFPSVSSAGGTSLFKDITSDTQINLKGIAVGSNKLTLTANTNDISLDVNEANLTLDNVGGTLGLAKGGTGKTLSAPGEDSIMFYDHDAGEMAWLSVSGNNSGLQIVDTAMSVAAQLSELYTKGTLLSKDDSGNDSPLSVGTNGYILKADSTTTTGLKWADIDDFQIAQLAFNDGFLGTSAGTGYLRTGSGLTWDSNDPGFESISVNPAQISLASCNNDANFRTITLPGGTFSAVHSHVDTNIDIVIGGNTYRIDAELQP